MRAPRARAARAALPLLAVAVLASFAPCALGSDVSGPAPAASAPLAEEDALTLARLEARIDKLVLEFAAAGFELERAELLVDAASPAAWASALARPERTLRALDDSPAAALLRGLHVRQQDDVAGAPATSLGATTRVRYDPTTGRLLVPEGTLLELMGEERALAHELARAWLDQRFGLARLDAAGLGARTVAPTLERAELVGGLQEGLADAIALEVALARGRRTLADLAPRQVEDTLARLAAAPGPIARYAAGRSFAVEGLRTHGRGFIEQVFGAPPTSTEQLIHAAKLHSDAPLAVELVDWPADWEPLPLVVDDVIGEQGLYDALLGAGLARPAAWRAAAGWDGDRIRLWSNEREALWAWRIVTDRDVDAAQLVSAWRRFEFRVQRSGRAFLCVLGTDAQHVEGILDRLAELSLADADPADAASTQACEDAMPELSSAARVEDGRWIVPSMGLSFPAPADWRAQKMSGTPFLFAPQRDAFIDNLNVRAVDDASGGDVRRIAAENRAGIEQMPEFRLGACEVVQLAQLEQEAVWVRYARSQGGNELEFCVLIIPRGEKLILVTASLLAERADETLPEVERALLGAREL